LLPVPSIDRFSAGAAFASRSRESARIARRPAFILFPRMKSGRPAGRVAIIANLNCRVQFSQFLAHGESLVRIIRVKDRPLLPAGVKWKIRSTERGCLDAISIESTV